MVKRPSPAVRSVRPVVAKFPQIEGCIGAVGTPSIGNLTHIGVLSEVRPDGIAQTQVSRGPDIGVSHSEDEEHLRRPRANPFEARELLDDVFGLSTR